MLLPLVLFPLVLALLALESIVVRRDVNRLRRRVHVGGTRGKSSVTRYIAAGLREHGSPTWAKITGIRPTLIRADGSGELIKRRGGPRVQEQFHIIHQAVRHGIDNLILECMSITPELQTVETRGFQPHVFVLTSIRDDHREHLGCPEEQAAAMCSAIPWRSLVITDDLAHRDVIDRTASARNSRVVFVTDKNVKPGKDCPSGVFPTNVALALRACEELGFDSHTSLTGILKEASHQCDKMVHLDLGGVEVQFVNGFAVNDIESSQQFLDYWRARVSEPSWQLMIMLNTRADRPLRSSLFAAWLGRMNNLSKVILLGDHTAYTRHALTSAGLNSDRIVVWRRSEVTAAQASLKQLGADKCLVVGLGNIGGDGFRVADALGVPV
jgi:poly-gamma-glutamate synthase PgsB/CapB